MFFRRQRDIQQAVLDYVSQTVQCLESFDQALEAYFARGPGEHLEALVEQTHRHETQADEMRRQIESLMFSRALIPEAREDIMVLLEAVDLVPNKAETVLYDLHLEGLKVPDWAAAQVRQMGTLAVACHHLLAQAVSQLFEDPPQVTPLAAKVSATEQQADEIKRQLTRRIFASDEQPADKILLKALVDQIDNIADRAEDASDRLRIIAVKSPG